MVHGHDLNHRFEVITILIAIVAAGCSTGRGGELDKAAREVSRNSNRDHCGEGLRVETGADEGIADCMIFHDDRGFGY